MANVDRASALKKIDKFLGTPLCLALSLRERLRRRPKSIPAPDQIQRVLVIKTVAIGDLVVALPTLRALRTRFPAAHIALLVTPRVREVVEGFPAVDEFIYFDVYGGDKGLGGFLRLLRRIRESRFDLVVDLEHYYRFTTILAYLSGAPHRVGFALPGQGRKGLFTLPVSYRVDVHEVKAFLQVAEALGAHADGESLEPLAVSPANRERVREILLENGLDGAGPLVAIHPGTSPVASVRRWPPARIAGLADCLAGELGAKVVFTGAEEDLPLVSEIMDLCRVSRPSVFAGRLSLKEFAAFAARADLVVSVDTGPMHVAAAMGAPVLGLFGPNTPAKWGPYGRGNRTVYSQLPCSPCTKQYLGQVTRCRDGRCMREINVEDVFEVAKEMLAERPERCSHGLKAAGAAGE